MQRFDMHPSTGERLLRFVGDRLRFTFSSDQEQAPAPPWRVLLRTNLGRAPTRRRAIIESPSRQPPAGDPSWRDIPMQFVDGEWQLDVCLTETGYFRAKAYAVDPKGQQHWPEGPDVGISVHPDQYRTNNILYCAFTRLFGESRTAVRLLDPSKESQLKPWDERGYTVIPPSGTLRDLVRQLPHIIDTLGCRIVHLLPVNPTPTTYARFGRFGSPYACLDYVAVDPAQIEFDQKTTGIDQFRELTDAVHARDARLFMDVVINHTGWGSKMQEEHPHWFLRKPDGCFASPGAWGVIWADLIEFDHRHPQLREELAEVFLTWCRRGVDGFRCDAGYMIPLPVWQYITARVHDEFPEALFFLEGLGGAWELTEALITEGGMQWAYSELFQNYSSQEISHYLDHALHVSAHHGLLVHYSETHDNNRLASQGKEWSLFRNRACALTSSSGGYGFTCGVEWLAPEKIDVHQCTGLAWDAPENLVDELKRLNELLSEHPSFRDGARLERFSSPDSPVYALLRTPAGGDSRTLVLLNPDTKVRQDFPLTEEMRNALPPLERDLLGQELPLIHTLADGSTTISIPPLGAYCLAAAERAEEPLGEAYRAARARAAAFLNALGRAVPMEQIGPFQWQQLADRVHRHGTLLPGLFGALDLAKLQKDLLGAIDDVLESNSYPQRILWSHEDKRRITPIPPHHWLIIQDPAPFRVSLFDAHDQPLEHHSSFPVQQGYLAYIPPGRTSGSAQLLLTRFCPDAERTTAQVRYLSALPDTTIWEARSGVSLLTNRRGGMSRIPIDVGRVHSKYDCVLAANLHPNFPVDRHLFLKRIRIWVNADGFLTALNGENLVQFIPGPPAEWLFLTSAGDGRVVALRLTADMLDDHNCVIFQFARTAKPNAQGRELPPEADVRLTVRLDIEDRNFHTETKHSEATEQHLTAHTAPLKDGIGFRFAPASDRQLTVRCDRGAYHSQGEWSFNIPHPVEKSRGQEGAGDAWSPGWFEIPLRIDHKSVLVASAEQEFPPASLIHSFKDHRRQRNRHLAEISQLPDQDSFGKRLAWALDAYVVRRNGGFTVVAGYPWFLDWGRDSLIVARGLIAAGWHHEVRQLLVTYGSYVENGTLPNTIHGEDIGNRDTSDAPLWFGVVCKELASIFGDSLYNTTVKNPGHTLTHVLREIATGYLNGTGNGIRVDPESFLVWSPSHFTWMDTNHPPGTPRAGYPVEIQVLWIRLLRLLANLKAAPHEGFPTWSELANRAENRFHDLFWLDSQGYLSDLLPCAQFRPAQACPADDALRCNMLLAVSLNLVRGNRARSCAKAAIDSLIIPGAIRTLAPKKVSIPLPVHGTDGKLLNDPDFPYWGRYEGDEDTRRKPAYHNGTAWTWPYPTFCEALVIAYEGSTTSVQAAKAYLAAMDRLLMQGCIGHLPEILDGDSPHAQRGCDAQAWGISEAFRVWKWLAG